MSCKCLKDVVSKLLKKYNNGICILEKEYIDGSTYPEIPFEYFKKNKKNELIKKTSSIKVKFCPFCGIKI